MKKILVGIVVVVLSLASVGAVVMADYWWDGNEMDKGRGGVVSSSSGMVLF